LLARARDRAVAKMTETGFLSSKIQSGRGDKLANDVMDISAWIALVAPF
jgi:hypothetical protein